MVISFALLAKQVQILFVIIFFHKVNLCRLHPIHVKTMDGFYAPFYKKGRVTAAFLISYGLHII